VTSKIVPDDQDLLAQERKLRRLYETGQLPADMQT
jgi:hypothetical protein